MQISLQNRMSSFAGLVTVKQSIRVLSLLAVTGICLLLIDYYSQKPVGFCSSLGSGVCCWSVFTVLESNIN